MKIIVGKSEKGGSLNHRSDSLEKASKDLEIQIGSGDIQALTTYEDDKYLYLIGAVKGKPEVSRPEKTAKIIRKRGK